MSDYCQIIRLLLQCYESLEFTQIQSVIHRVPVVFETFFAIRNPVVDQLISQLDVKRVEDGLDMLVIPEVDSPSFLSFASAFEISLRLGNEPKNADSTLAELLDKASTRSLLYKYLAFMRARLARMIEEDEREEYVEGAFLQWLDDICRTGAYSMYELLREWGGLLLRVLPVATVVRFFCMNVLKMQPKAGIMALASVMKRRTPAAEKEAIAATLLEARDIFKDYEDIMKALEELQNGNIKTMLNILTGIE